MEEKKKNLQDILEEVGKDGMGIIPFYDMDTKKLAKKDGVSEEYIINNIREFIQNE